MCICVYVSCIDAASLHKTVYLLILTAKSEDNYFYILGSSKTQETRESVTQDTNVLEKAITKIYNVKG